MPEGSTLHDALGQAPPAEVHGGTIEITLPVASETRAGAYILNNVVLASIMASPNAPATRRYSITVIVPSSTIAFLKSSFLADGFQRSA